MSLKTNVTGQYNLVDEASGTNFLSFDLSEIFPAITGIKSQSFDERQIIVGDGVVALNAGGVGTIKGFLLYISSGSGVVTVKHDSNTVGIKVAAGMIIHGEIAAVTIETASTTALTVKYLFFE